MKSLATASVALALFGCSKETPKSFGGEGSSVDQAIAITDAKGEVAGVAAENAWLARHYPGYRKGKQALISSGGRHYDKIEITTAEGAKTVYFDITEFFGK